MLKVVLDTNIFVSSLLSRTGTPAQVLNAWRDRQYVLCTSPAIITEIQRTLAYPRIREKYRLTDADIEDLLTLLHHDAVLVPGLANVRGAIPNDPDDEKFLACAIDAGADLIVSGDKHLLALSTYRDIPIVTARDFLQQMEKSAASFGDL